MNENSPIFHDITERIVADQRGWVANPFLLAGFPEKFGHLHTVSLQPGIIRGNHYHPNYREWFFTFGGKYTVFWQEGDDLRRNTIPSDRFIVTEIPVGLSHALRNDDNQTIYLIAFQNGVLEQIAADTVINIII